ncbi:MAG: hypothetical protein RIE53_08870 [Rhodothermales bacterium]
MTQFKMLALLSTLLVVLGYGASSPDRATEVALEAPSHVLEYGHWVVKRAETVWIMRRAAQGDACAQETAAYLHTRYARTEALSRYGRGRPGSWYTGITPDHEVARRFMERSIRNGGCEAGIYTAWLTDVLMRPSFTAYRDADGGLDWSAISAATDADARYLRAVAERTQSIWTEESGLEVNEAAALETLEELADAGHYHANVELLYTELASADRAYNAMNQFNPERHPVFMGRSSAMALFRQATSMARRTGDDALSARSVAFLNAVPGLSPEQRAAAYNGTY